MPTWAACFRIGSANDAWPSSPATYRAWNRGIRPFGRAHRPGSSGTGL